MCGIVYGNNFLGQDVTNQIIEQFKKQRNRGTSGFGFFLPQTNRLTHNTREGRILSLLKRENTKEVLFHHRLPTSTANVRNACHPFSTKEYFGDHSYILVHNGMISNTEALAKKHAEYGIEYVSKQRLNDKFNDTEALLWDVAMVLEGWQEELEAQGSIAFVAVKLNKEKKPIAVYFGRNNRNPLKVKLTKTSLFISSEGEGKEVEPDMLHEFNYGTFEIKKTPLTIPIYSFSAPSRSTGGAGDTSNWKSTPIHRGGQHGFGAHTNSCYTPNSFAASVGERKHAELENDDGELDFVLDLTKLTINDESAIKDELYGDKGDFDIIDECATQALEECNNDPKKAILLLARKVEEYGDEAKQIEDRFNRNKWVMPDDEKMYQIATLEISIFLEASDLVHAMINETGASSGGGQTNLVPALVG